MKLKEKICIITGGAKGIGEASSILFAKEGATVVICDMDQEALDKTLEQVKAISPNSMAVKIDISNKDEVIKMTQSVVEKFGRIDVLVNNAGIIRDAQIQKMTDEQFDSVININLRGAYYCMQAVIEPMRNQKSGSIINTSSIVGLYGNFGQVNYAATKSGIIGMTKALAKEQGRKGIRCNAVCPGFINTTILQTMPENIINGMKEKVALGRLGEPEEIASVYAFLASEEASYINGAVIDVSGYTTI